jgi:hypothetical protein
MVNQVNPRTKNFGGGIRSVKSIRAIFNLILRIIEVFLGIRFITHFFSGDGFLAGLAEDVGNILEYLNFDEILPASSGIERPLALLVLVLMFMLVGYILILFLPKFNEKGRQSIH